MKDIDSEKGAPSCLTFPRDYARTRPDIYSFYRQPINHLNMIAT